MPIINGIMFSNALKHSNKKSTNSLNFVLYIIKQSEDPNDGKFIVRNTLGNVKSVYDMIS